MHAALNNQCVTVTNTNRKRSVAIEFGFDLVEFLGERGSQLYFARVNTANSKHHREVYPVTAVLVDAMRSLTLLSFSICVTIYISGSRDRERRE